MSLIADMIRAGVDPEIVQKVSDALAEERARGAMEAALELAADRKSVGAVRQARYRERKASQNVTDRNDVTLVTACYAQKEKSPHTPQKENPPPSKENPPKGGQKKGSRLPADWQPEAADRGYAVSVLGRQKTDLEIAKFRDYWAAATGQNATKADWNATFRNWVRKAGEFAPRGSGPMFSHPPPASVQPSEIVPEFASEAEFDDWWVSRRKPGEPAHAERDV